MRIAIAYPPIPSEKGAPLLGQNRQFQWFNTPTYIYPVVPAQAATLLAQEGHEVFWLDGIAEEWTPPLFEEKLDAAAPDILMLETKTPVVRFHWDWINRYKARRPEVKVVLVGDHATALPQESLEQSAVDAVLTGGDYDFLLLNFTRHLACGEPLEPGIYLRGEPPPEPFQLNHDLNTLPFIDRDLTRWQLYAEKNGNFRRTPGTYIMAGRDCWHGRCTFCSWTTLYPTYRRRSPENVLDEIGQLIEKYPIREIMDDTGCFSAGDWLRTFCRGMIDRGYHKRVTLDCNMRFGCLSAEDYRLMKQAGFRLVLFGVESANQATLDRLNKALTLEQITEGARLASRAGLDVHVTLMFGYPWETTEDVERTIALGRCLLRRGYASTLQATLTIPYPGTPLFKELQADGGLLTENWDDYDMRMNVMRGGLSEAEIKTAIRRVYSAFFHPETLFRRLLHTRHPIDDARFYLRGFRSIIGHLTDFR